jgi:hypothetical protein
MKEVLATVLILLNFSQMEFAQILGLVSKGCSNYYAKDCEKIPIDRNGNRLNLNLDKNYRLEGIDTETSRFIFSYKNDSRELYGLLDFLGNEIIKPRFERIESFSEGLAFVRISDNDVGFINSNGKVVIKSSAFEEEGYSSSPKRMYYFSEGLALIALQVGYSFKNDYRIIKYGFIDKKGKLVVGKTNKPLVTLNGIRTQPKFDDAKNFSEGLAPVELKGKWGFINAVNKVVIDFQFDDAKNFSEGLASINKDGKYGFIDKLGKIVINPQFSNTGDFSEGLDAFENSNGNWGFINRLGETEIKPIFPNKPGEFHEARARIFEGIKGFGFIDKEGKIIIETQLGGAGNFINGFAWIMRKGGVGYIKPNGEYLWNPNP